MTNWVRRIYPFNAEQTVNILSEFGPLVTMFVVNGITRDINAGTWGLIISTVIAMATMRVVLGRFPVFPIIASSVTIFFGVLTLVTHDPMWVQIKVSIFNALFAGFLFGGLVATSRLFSRQSLLTVIGLVLLGALLQVPLVQTAMATQWPALGDDNNPLFANLLCIGSMAVGLLVGMGFRRNFFTYVFEKTFHYTEEGWDRFTYSFAWFFVFTAVLNEVIRQVFDAETDYLLPLFGHRSGVDIWILFKIVLIMPASGLYAWYLARLMQKHRMPDRSEQAAGSPTGGSARGPQKLAAESNLAHPPVVRSPAE